MRRPDEFDQLRMAEDALGSERMTGPRPEAAGVRLTRRLIDILVGGALAIIVLPLIILLAIGSAVVFRSWPLFLHERVGYRGRPFRVLKLRTLPPRTPVDATKYHLATLELCRWTRFLRTTHLDELPQLLLVPVGLMSLVGPRPEMPRLHNLGDPTFAELRISRRPGCTGLWQIGVDSHRLIWEAPAYDVFYMQHHSLRLDLWILWRTALMFAHVGRPLTLDDVPHWVRRADVSADVPLRLEPAAMSASYSAASGSG